MKLLFLVLSLLQIWVPGVLLFRILILLRHPGFYPVYNHMNVASDIAIKGNECNACIPGYSHFRACKRASKKHCLVVLSHAG